MIYWSEDPRGADILLPVEFLGVPDVGCNSTLDWWVIGGFGTWADQMDTNIVANAHVQLGEMRGTSSQQANPIVHAWYNGNTWTAKAEDMAAKPEPLPGGSAQPTPITESQGLWPHNVSGATYRFSRKDQIQPALERLYIPSGIWQTQVPPTPSS